MSEGSGRRPIGIAVIAILLGLWNMMGCLTALGSLSDSSEVPDNPFLSSAQNRAVQELAASVEAYEPVTGALSALTALSGPLLLVAGILLAVGLAHAPLVGRVAFGASIVVDGLQAIWSLIWYGLTWRPMTRYVEAISASLPDPPPPDMTGAVTGTAIAIVAAMGLAFFAVKIALALAGLAVTGRLDRHEAEPAFAPPRDPGEEGVGWAVDPD